MKTLRRWPALLLIAAAAVLADARTPRNHQTLPEPFAPHSIGRVESVSVRQDRDKGVVTLGGHVALDSEKVQVESIARSLANGQVVSDWIEVLPMGAENEAKAMNSDLDKGIVQNLDAVLIQSKLRDRVKFPVKNRVVTLTGEAASQSRWREAERVAAAVPNVQQVVNELQVKNQKATE